MKDIVYKRDAIDAVKTYWKANVDAIPKDTDFDTMTDICNTILRHNAEICRALDHLPSAQPGRKKGKWIIDHLCSTGGGTYQVLRCNICEHSEPWQMGRNYCPNCGADMRGEQDE